MLKMWIYDKQQNLQGLHPAGRTEQAETQATNSIYLMIKYSFIHISRSLLNKGRVFGTWGIVDSFAARP